MDIQKRIVRVEEENLKIISESEERRVGEFEKRLKMEEEIQELREELSVTKTRLANETKENQDSSSALCNSQKTRVIRELDEFSRGGTRLHEKTRPPN